MEKRVKETYTKDGNTLTELIQEWINENISILYCDNEKRNKYR